MFISYKVLPMTADGDIYALYDPKGNPVAMGTRQVCQTLLHLVTHSPLMERPPRHHEKIASQQRARAAAAATGGGAELNPDGCAVGVPGTNGATDGARVSASVSGPKEPPPPGRGFEAQDVEEDAPGLPTAAERRLTRVHPTVRMLRSDSEADAEPYGVLELIYLGSRSVASHWYFSLPVVIVIGSALLMWSLFPNG